MKLTQSEMINRLARWVILLTFSVLVTSGCSDESSEDPCNAIICENGGSCLEGLCDCGEGFEGDFCENVIDEDAPPHGILEVDLKGILDGNLDGESMR